MSNYQALDGAVDKFDTFYETVKKNEVQVQNLIQQRDQKLQQDENIYATDRELRSSLQQYYKGLQEMQNMVISYSSSKSQMLPQEAQRRRNILNELMNKYTNLSTKAFAKDIKSKPTLFDGSKGSQVNQSGKSQMELNLIQKDLFQSQDQQVDILNQQVDRLGHHSKVIGLALDEDKTLIGKLDSKVYCSVYSTYFKVGQASKEIKETESKLNGFLARTSNCCLWTTILIELMIFIMLVIY